MGFVPKEAGGKQRLKHDTERDRRSAKMKTVKSGDDADITQMKSSTKKSNDQETSEATEATRTMKPTTQRRASANGNSKLVERWLQNAQKSDSKRCLDENVSLAPEAALRKERSNLHVDVDETTSLTDHGKNHRMGDEKKKEIPLETWRKQASGRKLCDDYLKNSVNDMDSELKKESPIEVWRKQASRRKLCQDHVEDGAVDIGKKESPLEVWRKQASRRKLYDTTSMVNTVGDGQKKNSPHEIWQKQPSRRNSLSTDGILVQDEDDDEKKNKQRPKEFRKAYSCRGLHVSNHDSTNSESKLNNHQRPGGLSAMGRSGSVWKLVQDQEQKERNNKARNNAWNKNNNPKDDKPKNSKLANRWVEQAMQQKTESQKMEESKKASKSLEVWRTQASQRKLVT